MNSETTADTGQPPFVALHEAAEWFATLRDERADSERREQWQHWLQASPAHRDAWAKVESIAQQFVRLDAPAARQALRDARPDRRRALRLGLALSASALLPALVARHLPWGAWTADRRTAIGETREWPLADGSRLWLSTDSAASLHYDARWRRIVLRRGELLIETASDPASPPRPLIVETAHGRLRALGTRFSVRDHGDETRVAVFAGAVEVQPIDGEPARIETGQQLDFAADRVHAPGAADPARAAWVDGSLVADNQRLADFLAELSRYRRGHIACAPEVADLRLVGSYPTRDPERVLTAIAETLPVTVERPLPWWIEVRARR